MNRYKLAKAGINANQGINRFNNNAELYEKLLLGFPNDPNFQKMCDSIESQNVEGAFAAAHALKGISGNLSINNLFEDIKPLVEELRAGSLEKVDDLLPPVKADYEMVIEALKETV